MEPNLADGRWVEAVDPTGAVERAEFKRHPAIKANDAQLMPPGFVGRYPGGSFYWNQRAMALYPRDYNRAQHTRWLFGSDGEGSVDIPHSLKGAEVTDTYQTWFTYPGQTNANQKGALSLPSQVIRNTGDGFQTWRYEYNDLGRPTKVIDPMGRETSLSYAANLMDLAEVRQTSNGRNDLLAKYTYNDQHLPLTATDAADQVTRFAYNAAGQLTSLTNPAASSAWEAAPTPAAPSPPPFKPKPSNASASPCRSQQRNPEIHKIALSIMGITPGALWNFGPEGRARLLALQDSQLMTQREVL